MKNGSRMFLVISPLVLTMLAAIVVASAASVGTVQWVSQFGTASDDGFLGSFAPRVAVHSSGVYVTGFVGGALPAQTSAGLRDVFVRRYDFGGTEIWTRQFGSAAHDTAQAISVDDTGVYVAGGTGGTLPAQVSSGSFDAFVRKYDFGGNEQWTRQFGTPGGEEAWGISVHASGVYVAGYICGAAFPGQTDAGGFCDGWVRKYDLDGAEVWTRQFGTPAIDWVLAISVDATAVYVAGRTDGDLAQPGAGAFDGFVRKYDLDGNVAWTKQLGTPGNDEVFGISAHSPGIYIAGYTAGTLPDQLPSEGGPDAFVRKYDVDGTEVWTRQFGTAGADIAGAVSLEASRLYVSGRTDGIFLGQAPAGGVDAFVSRFDLDGNVLWTSQMGTPGTDVARSVAGGSSGAYISGFTDGTFPGQTSAGGFDVFVAKLTDVFSIMIDIQPGDEPNTINCNNANGLLTVAILTTNTFDALSVDHTTVFFEGASEIHTHQNTGEPIRHEEDVDGDGDLDLIFHFRRGDTSLTCDSTEGVLAGETFEGQAVEGTDQVRMIKPGPPLPIISVVSGEQAVVSWTTELPTTGEVFYGTQPGVYSQSAIDPAYSLSHQIPLTGLTPFTAYYYQVRIEYESGEIFDSIENGFVSQVLLYIPVIKR